MTAGMLRVIRVKLINAAFVLSCNKSAAYGFGFFDHTIFHCIVSMTWCLFLVIFALNWLDLIALYSHSAV